MSSPSGEPTARLRCRHQRPDYPSTQSRSRGIARVTVVTGSSGSTRRPSRLPGRSASHCPQGHPGRVDHVAASGCRLASPATLRPVPDSAPTRAGDSESRTAGRRLHKTQLRQRGRPIALGNKSPTRANARKHNAGPRQCARPQGFRLHGPHAPGASTDVRRVAEHAAQVAAFRRCAQPLPRQLSCREGCNTLRRPQGPDKDEAVVAGQGHPSDQRAIVDPGGLCAADVAEDAAQGDGRGRRRRIDQREPSFEVTPPDVAVACLQVDVVNPDCARGSAKSQI